MTGYLLALWTGFVLDLFVGDPHGMWHPVRGIGRIISFMEGKLLKTQKKSDREETAGGILLVAVVLAATGVIVYGSLLLARGLGWVAYLGLSAVYCWWILAAKSLKTESMKVYTALETDDIPAARKAVSMIVGRDTAGLSKEQITKAAIETVAENTSDGVIAPLFYLALGGPVLGFLYKAVNTMDSMIGYHSERYEYFGKMAARLDDFLNFIPARLSAMLMILSASLTGLDGKGAWNIFLRDRYKHKSPNSAQTEAVCAGALGLQLAGDASYFGVIHHKETIGDETRKAVPQDIILANRLMYAATICMMLLATVMIRLLGEYLWII